MSDDSSVRPCHASSSRQGVLWRDARESGVILLQTVILVLLLNLIGFTIASLSIRATQIERLHHLERQAYWLARSESVVLLDELQDGVLPSNQNMTMQNGQSVTVDVVTGTPVVIYITGRSGVSSDTIQLSYNVTTKTVTLWRDGVQR